MHGNFISYKNGKLVLIMAKRKTDERNGENVDGEEPNFDDPEDYEDDISDQGASHCIYIGVHLCRS